MKPSIRKLSIAACSLGGILLGLFAAYSYYVYRSQLVLKFEKDIIDLRGQTTFEGEVIRIQNSLIHNGSGVLEIKGIPASCGCLVIRRNDTPLSYPIRLIPKSRLPLDIRIYTQGRFGEQLVTARAEAIDEHGERYESLPLQIAFKVISRVYVIPYDQFVKVKVSDQQVRPVRHTLLVASRGEPCTKLTIETAHKQRFKFDVKKVDGTVDYNGLTLNKCFEVDLCYLPAQGVEMFSETLQFTPDDQQALARNVRFDGVIEYPYRIEPESLMILRSGREAEITETAVYKCQNNDYRNLQVKTLPKGFRTLITNYDQNTKLLTFYIKRDEVDWQKTEDSIVLDLGQGEALRIPVK